MFSLDGVRKAAGEQQRTRHVPILVEELYESLPRRRNIWIYGAANIMVFGTIGRTLLANVMTRKRRLTTSIYLIVLTIDLKEN